MRRLMQVIAWASASCASVSPPEPRPSLFPSPESLADLLTEPDPAPPSVDSPDDLLARFELVGPGFTGLQRARVPPQLESRLQELQGPKWLFGQGMVCVAKEIGRYLAQAARPPPLDLLHRMGPVCGSLAPTLRFRHWTLENADELEGPEIERAMRAIFEEGLESLEKGAELEVGFATRRSNGALYMVLAWGEVAARVESLRLEDDELLVEGSILKSTGTLRAVVTRGPFGYQDCSEDPLIPLPRFRVRCPVSEDDPVIRFDLLSAVQSRLLADLQLRMALSRGEVMREEVRRSADPSTVGPTLEALTSSANEWRQRAGLEPLRLETAQSEFNAALCPRFFEAQRSGDRETMDRVVLGILAGHQLLDPISRADFLSRPLPPASAAPEILAELLEAPHGRSLILSPDADRIAFGLSPEPETGVLRLVVSSYAGVEADAAEASRARALEILNRERISRGHRPAQSVGLVGNKSMAERVVRHEASVDALMRDYLRQGKRRHPGRLIEVQAQEVHDLEGWVPDPRLVQAPVLKLDLDTIVYRPLGARWSTTLIVTTRIAEPPA